MPKFSTCHLILQLGKKQKWWGTLLGFPINKFTLKSHTKFLRRHRSLLQSCFLLSDPTVQHEKRYSSFHGGNCWSIWLWWKIDFLDSFGLFFGGRWGVKLGMILQISFDGLSKQNNEIFDIYLLSSIFSLVYRFSFNCLWSRQTIQFQQDNHLFAIQASFSLLGSWLTYY